VPKRAHKFHPEWNYTLSHNHSNPSNNNVVMPRCLAPTRISDKRIEPLDCIIDVSELAAASKRLFNLNS
jgi:hypothetical protein